MSRARGIVETSEYASFARRTLRAWGKRVADGDEPELEDLARFVDELDEIVAQAISGYLEKDDGVQNQLRTRTWAKVAEIFHVDRQTAWRRWAKANRRATAP